MPRRRTRILSIAAWPAALAAVLFAALTLGASSRTPPVQLVETRPIETTLGNPELPAALDTWLALIASARKTLDLEQFYLSTWPGEPMEPVLAAIGKAAARGVRVRLLLDSRMYRTYPRTADSLARIRNIEVRRIDMGRIAGGIQHAKYFLVDGETTFLGSQNFDWRALEHIHELGVTIRDRAATAVYAAVFDMDWKAAGLDSAAGRPEVKARDLHSHLPFRYVQAPGDTLSLWPSFSPRGFIPDETLWDRDAIVRLIDRAKHEIVVQLLSYSPEGRGEDDHTIDDALRRAAGRGVKVKLLISDWETDSPALRLLQATAMVPNIEVKLGTVPEWSGGYIPFARVEHCKYMVVDTLWTWVGTANWEPSYFSKTRNVAATMLDRPLARQARTIFTNSWTAPGAHELDPRGQYPQKIHGEKPPPGETKYGG